MIIVCKTKDINKLNEKSINMGYGLSEYTLSGLEVGKTYKVYGMGLWEEDHMLYLIDKEENNSPLWYPFEVFDIVDNKLTSAWCINNFGELIEDTNITFIWGYSELVFDITHAGLLMERDKTALNTFSQRKTEL